MCHHHKERGAAIVFFSFVLLLVVIPAIGIAIDATILYWAKARLSAAVDAAALAAGRSINVFVAQSTNNGTVKNVGRQWFAANFPAGWLGTSIINGQPDSNQPTIITEPTASGKQRVSVQATATVPLYFMRLFGYNTANVSAAAESSRKNVNIVLVLDRSGSMAINGGVPCNSMKASAVNFVNMFTENFDSFGLVTYSTSANHSPIDFPISTKFLSGSPSITSVINSLSCVGGTNMTDGLYYAFQAIKANGLAGGQNVILLFTDGQPNAMTASGWVTRTSSSDNNIRYDPVSTSSTIATTSNYGPSTCTTSLPAGILLPLYPVGNPTPHVQGYTGGLYDPDAHVSLTSSAGQLGIAGCYMNASVLYARLDIAYIPSTDRWGDSTSGYKAVDTFISGPYQYKIRPDEQLNGIISAATNSADNLAHSVRTDAVYPTVIYAIGLGGAPDLPIDQVLMERLANDDRSPIYSTAQPKGYFAYASDPAFLNEAFQEVASQILRLSQ